MRRGLSLKPFCLLAVFAWAGAGGCAFGPKAIQKTHGMYAESVRQVEEEQLLRHIIHLRYNETALNLDITSIAAQYEASASVEARPFFVAPNPGSNAFRTFTSILPDLSISGSNRPTITYAPLNDGTSVRRYLTPITLETLVLLTQTSWPVSSVLRLWVERINGVPNAVTASGPQRAVIPDYARFRQAAELLQTAQDRELASVRTEERVVETSASFAAESVTPAVALEASKAGLEYRPDADGKRSTLVRRDRRLYVEVSSGAENSPELLELSSLLNLVPRKNRYDVMLASRGSPDPMKFPSPPEDTFRIVPRSTAQVLFYLSNGIEVPAEHICAGLVPQSLGADGQPFDPRTITDGLFAVHVCKGRKQPPNAHIAVNYRGFWYYIDDADRDSKATFALVLQLSRLDFARQSIGSSPTLTLPVGR